VTAGTTTDEELIRSSWSEPAAFAGIFDRHHAQLYRYLSRRVGAGLAADLAAETFVTAFARRGDYRPDTSDARPWLYGIAHNLLRNHLRDERRQLAAYARRGADPPADPDSAAEFSLADSRADSAAISAGPRPGRAVAVRLGRPVLRRDRGGAGDPGRHRQIQA
jgi:DNA-directed RNA polymerase specialized sigma24 family protein